MPLEKDLYSAYQIADIESFQKCLNSETENLRVQLRKIIDRYQFENLPNLPDNEKDIANLVFQHGAGDYHFRFEAFTKNYEDALSDSKIEYHFPNIGVGISPKDFAYPEEWDVYLEPEKDERAHSRQVQLFFTWFAKNWLESGGHKIGTVTYTLENSYGTILNLNRITWDDSYASNYEEGGRVEYPFTRDLTEYEIAERIGFPGGGKYYTIWRYFEKGETFLETGNYGGLVYIRQGNKVDFATQNFELFDDYIKKIEKQKSKLSFHENLINTGFYEKERPSVFPKIHRDLIEWTGIIASKEDFIPVSETDFEQFEESNQVKLVSSYKWFISRVNNGKIHRSASHFRIAKGEWKKFIKIFNFHKIDSYKKAFHAKHEVAIDLIPIASSEEKGVVLLHPKRDCVFYFSPEKGLIETPYDFENFIGNCTDVSSYFDPLRYHLERRNLTVIKQLFSNGVQLSDFKLLGKRSILQDIQNDIELTKFLLEQGADPNDIYIYADLVSKEYIESLVAYGMDFKGKLEDENQQHLQKQFARREGFEEFIQQYLD